MAPIKLLKKLLTAVALFGTAAPLAQAQIEDSAQDTVLRFAETFLGEAATARLSDPIGSDYEALYMLDIDPQTADPTLFDDGVWGQILLSEMLDFSEKAVWLDWKYNVLTMVEDDDWSNQLGLIFSMYGAAPLTPEEREGILNKAQREHGDRPEVMMFPDLQPLAETRGYRLMVVENQSDGLGLFMLPKDQATDWHMTHLGHVLLIDAAAGTVADPRSGGKLVQLTN